MCDPDKDSLKFDDKICNLSDRFAKVLLQALFFKLFMLSYTFAHWPEACPIRPGYMRVVIPLGYSKDGRSR